MASIFLSHSSKDAETCDAVARFLQARGHSPLFVHRRPAESDFIGDQDWAKEVAARSAGYEIFIALLSEAWFNSDECRVEAKFASRSGRTMLPLFLGGQAPSAEMLVPDWARANLIPFSRDRDDDRELTELERQKLDQALTRVGANPDSFEPDPDRKPFPGLNAFERRDAAVYFGRDSDIRQLRERLRSMRRGDRERESPRQCLVVGPSGAGKSSLMRAGVLARLEREPHEWLCPTTVTPSGDLIAALTDSLTKLTGLSRPRIRKALTSGAAQDLTDLVKAARERHGQPQASLLLSIDQMEEAFASGLIDDTLTLFEAHRDMDVPLDDPMPLIILGTLRADSYAGLCERPDVAGLMLETHRVAPLPIEYLSEVIRGPLRVWSRPIRDVDIEPAVVDRMLADARRIGGGRESGAGDVLPLVAIALRQLWDDHAHTEWFAGLTEAHYEETGGLSAIIDEQGTHALRRIKREVGLTKEELLDALIPAVATADAHGNRVRAWSPESEFDSRVQAALKVLCEERLLHADSRRTSNENATAETVYSVAHEVVLRQWAILAHALDEQADHLMLKARILEEAMAWARASSRSATEDPTESLNQEEVNSSSHLLLEGDRLVKARALEWPADEASLVTSYIVACEAKQERRVQTLVEGERNLEQSRQQYLALRAKELSDKGEHLSAMRLALAAWPESGSLCSDLSSTLSVISSRSYFRMFVIEHESDILSLDWSPDGEWLVTGGGDGKVVIWDARTFQLLDSMVVGLCSSVHSVSCAPDAKSVAIGCDDGVAFIWYIHDQYSIRIAVNEDSNFIEAVAWSPDGKLIATGGSDTNIDLWNSESGNRIGQPLKGHSDIVTSLAWSPDGHSLISAAHDKKIIRWDCKARMPLGDPIISHAQKVNSIEWSPDGLSFASVGNDSKLMIWNAESNELNRGPLSGHMDLVLDVAWSPDSQLLATCGKDGKLIVWDARSGDILSQQTIDSRHCLHAVSFSPNSRWVVVGDSKGKLGIFDVLALRACRRNTSTSQEQVKRVFLSPDGQHFASENYDNEVSFWDSRSGKRLSGPVGANQESIWTMAWSVAGQRFAAGAKGRTITLWDVDRGVAIREPWEAHKENISTLALSATGGWLASGDHSGILMIWDLNKRVPAITHKISHRGTIGAAAWSPNGQQLASACRGSILLRSLKTGELVGEASIGAEIEIRAVAWSPDGRQLAAAGSDRIAIWFSDTLDPVCNIHSGPNDFILSLSWSPKYDRIASYGMGEWVSLWDTYTGKRVADPIGGVAGVYTNNIAWDRDGRGLIMLDEFMTVVRKRITWETILSGSMLPEAVARRRLQGAEQLNETESRVVSELYGQDPDRYLIPKRWGYGGPKDDPFGDPLKSPIGDP